MTDKPTQAQIEAVWNEMSPQLKILIAKAFNHALTAAAEAGDKQWGDNTHRLLGEMIEQIKIMQRENTAATIERCAQWLIDEAKALRSQVSGGDGSESQWIEAKALDRVAAAIRAVKD